MQCIENKFSIFDNNNDIVGFNNELKAQYLNYYLNKQRKSPNTNTNSLLFVNNPQLIKGVYHDLEVTA